MIIKVIFENDKDFDYIYCSNNISININKFSNWIYNDKTHPFWVYEGNNVLGVDYRSDAIVYWINKYKNTSSYVLKDFSNENMSYDLMIKL